MNATLWLAGALACAQVGPPAEQIARPQVQDVQTHAESGPRPRPAASKITDVTVYHRSQQVHHGDSQHEDEG
jgi:hypothetical protein